MNKKLLLWLEGPIQSWVFESKFNFGVKRTFQTPTKSGIMGLICCALGKNKGEEEFLSSFIGLQQDVYSYKKEDYKKEDNDILTDFNMISSNYCKNNSWERSMFLVNGDGKVPTKSSGGSGQESEGKLSYKKYLMNACFAVILEIPNEYEDLITKALINPYWPIFLGRKTCTPSEFVFQGLFDSDEQAVQKINILSNEKKLRLTSMNSDKEFNDYDEKIILNDVLLSLGFRKEYQGREVFIKNYD